MDNMFARSCRGRSCAQKMMFLVLTGSTVFPIDGAEHGLKWRFVSIFKRRFLLFGVVEEKERYSRIRLGKLQCKSDFRFGLSCIVLPVKIIEDINFNTSTFLFDVVEPNG
jgi:hypothetical protein